MNKQIIKELAYIYTSLMDDLSKKLYINRLNWLVTGDFKYIEKIVNLSHPNIPVWNQRSEKEFISLLPKNEKIVFYGAGSFAERLVPYLNKITAKIEFCDSSVEKQKNGFHGFDVISPQELINMKEKKRVIICTTKYLEDVEKYLIRSGLKKEELIDIRGYFKCGTGDDYFYENFIRYFDEEIFIDAGCYDLGTTSDFYKVCKQLKKVYAFEPDQGNYEKCKQRLRREKEHFPEVVMLPYGTWSSSTELNFSATSDGCSHIGEGGTVIKTAAIDEIVDEDDRITFIKMDVEGAELESLIGSKKTIQRDHPKLAICVYHKPEDIITLPLYIKSLVPEYKFYLRSYSNADNEMVLYAIP